MPPVPGVKIPGVRALSSPRQFEPSAPGPAARRPETRQGADASAPPASTATATARLVA